MPAPSQWWDVSFAQRRKGKPADLEAELLHLMRQAVTSRMVADVPLVDPSEGLHAAIALENAAIVARWKQTTSQDIDGETQVTVTSGCTEALAAVFLGLINPGDEVILFEPYYQYHATALKSVDAVPVAVRMQPPDWTFSLDEVERAVTDRG